MRNGKKNHRWYSADSDNILLTGIMIRRSLNFTSVIRGPGMKGIKQEIEI